MFQWLGRLFGKSPSAIPARRAKGLFSTQGDLAYGRERARLPEWRQPKLKRLVPATPEGTGMDANDAEDSVKPFYGDGNVGVPDAQVYWFAAQSFIGYQMMALIAQHWLVEKACSMPAKDAIRKGYDISIDDGTELDPKVTDYIRNQDKVFGINKQLIEFVTKGRMFGIRIAKFDVKSSDPEYYKKPFNIDGVEPGAYRGIIQIDPFWITPILVSDEAVTPGTSRFYKPDYWMVGGQEIHWTHLVIYITSEVADVLKPSYFYGGISITQRIYERVYASERTANEAPMLAMTKRLNVMKTDLEEAIANEAKFEQRMNWQTANRDNYGTRFIGPDDEMDQHDLTLTDLDNVIMTQYQLVAAIAEVPGTKLLGTQPKGFNSTGQFEEASYHEMLESLQSNDITPLLTRHYMLLVKSHVAPKFGMQPFNVNVSWNELDAMTSQEQAAVNLTKGQTDQLYAALGAIDSQDVRNRIISDPDSGYSGLSDELPPMPDTEPTPGQGDTPPPASAPKAPAEKGA